MKAVSCCIVTFIFLIQCEGQNVDNKTMKIFKEVVQKKIFSTQKIFFNIVKVTKNLHIKSFLRNIYKKSLNFIEKI